MNVSNKTLSPVIAADSARRAARRAPSRHAIYGIALVAGLAAAILTGATLNWGTMWGTSPLWERISIRSAFRENHAGTSSAFSTLGGSETGPDQERGANRTNLDSQPPQRQAEVLLARAVEHSEEAVRQIESRLPTWWGKLRWDAQLGQLITAALNSKDRKVRDSAIEVQLAAYRLTKRDSTVDALVKQARSSDHAQQIWALWSMGLLANRGIGTGRIIEVLAARLKASDHGLQERAEDVRLWAVQSLALIGTAASIEPLLDAMRHDPSAMVRERAASGLADSLMLSHDQRMLAVPQLIDFSGDPSLDAQTRAWAFQALADITQERLPSTSAAWREWYRLHGRG